MKTFLLSVLSVLALNVQAIEVKNDTIDKYVIDKQVVKRFDGTQLEGKTISKYIIAYKNNGNVVERTHVIFTGDKDLAAYGIKLDNNMNGMVYEGLIIVDGKEVEAKDLKTFVKANDMVSVDIHKPGSNVAKSYGKKGEKGVVTIVTKAGKGKNGTIYFVNGEKTETKDVDKLSSDKITSMTVDKRSGVSVIKITTKK